MPTLYSGLLISCRRNFESNASSEIHFALTNELKLNSEDIKAKNTGISGLITVRLNNMDNLHVVDQLKELEKVNSYFIHCLKIKPIMYTIKNDFEDLSEIVKDHLDEINGNYKIEVNKRHSSLRSIEVIKVIADIVKNPVSLDNPDTLVLVEIIGDKLGLSIINPKYIFATNKAIEESSDSTENWFLT